jgi:hypothetical protein
MSVDGLIREIPLGCSGAALRGESCSKNIFRMPDLSRPDAIDVQG